MGNLSTNNPSVVNQSALVNAEKASGGAFPPAATNRALGTPRDIAHERALYDMGVSGQLSDVAGGSSLTYKGTIVPENPQQEQITEARFLEVLAGEFARRITGIGMGDGPDPEFTEMSRGLLERFFTVLVPPGARVERVLRAALNMPEDLDVYMSPNDFAEGLMSKLVPFIDNLELLTKLNDGIEAWNKAKSPSDYEAAASQLFTDAGIMWLQPEDAEATNSPGQRGMAARNITPKGIKWFPKGGGPGGDYPFYRFAQMVGNEVHTQMQAHYWLAHPDDVLMFEDFLVAGPKRLATIWQAGTWSAPYEWLSELRAALMTKVRTGQDTGLTKRPDILNLTKKHLYEIKTINQALDGVEQVAEYYARLSPVIPELRLAGMMPDDWRPFPIYWTGGTTMAMAEVFAPGVITYQRIGTRVPVTNPLRAWSEEKKNYYQRQEARVRVASSTALAVVGFIGVLLLAAALAPAAIAAGAAIGAAAEGMFASELAVTTGLAYAL